MKEFRLILTFLLLSQLSIGGVNAQTAASFTGTSNYISVPYFAVTPEISIEAWVKTTQTKVCTIVSWKNTTANAEATIFRMNAAGKVELGEWIGNTWKTVNSTTSVNTGAWFHVAVTRTGTTGKIYVNGVLEATSTTLHTSAQCTADKTVLGAITSATSESFIGLIDEVRIWSSVRTDAEISSNLFSVLTGTDATLKAYYRFESNMNDLTANAYNGVITGAVPYVNSTALDGATPPAIASGTITETNGNPVSLKVNINKESTAYWAILPSSAAAPSSAQIIAGTGATAFGTLNYTTPSVDAPIFLNTPLVVGTSYTAYIVSKGFNVAYSNILTTLPLTYQGLFQLPAGWKNTDIGAVGLLGSSAANASKITLSGAGADIWGNTDELQYCYTTATGNTEIIAKINSQQNTNAWAKSGVMMRQTINGSSNAAMVDVTPSNGINLMFRRTDNSSLIMNSNNEIAAITPPVWVRLAYKDNYVAGYYSKDGKKWIKIGESGFSVNFSNSYTIGLAACSHNRAQTCATEFDSISVHTTPDSLKVKDKGLYFASQPYIPIAAPVFSGIKSQLPTPILDGNPGWIDMYWKAWSLGISHIRTPQSTSPFVSNWYDEVFDNNIYQWDIIFMTMFGRYGHSVFPAINSLDNFYCLQDEDGYICRIIDEKTGSFYPVSKFTDYMVNPPLFSWAEMESFKLTGDLARLTLVLPVLEKYFAWVEKYRKADGTPHLLYWNTGLGSGMDNTPRPTSNKHGWIDMSCQMVIQAANISSICTELGLTDKATYYSNKAADIASRINTYMWNDVDGMYYDVDALGAQLKVKTAASFWPMVAGITTPSQTQKMITNLQDPATFWRPMVFPTLAANDPSYFNNGFYWKGGVWAPTNYAIIKGLQVTGNNAFGKLATEKYIAGLYDVFLSTGTLWENYAPELIGNQFSKGTNDKNTGSCATDFVGWTGLGPISLLIEDVIGIRANGVAKTINWYLDRKDRNGILNLNFGGITTSLECAARTDSAATAYLTVTSDKPYLLVLKKAGQECRFDIKVGVNNLVCESSSTAVKTIGNDNFNIQIYPNPASDNIIITGADLKENAFIEIYNSQGQVVKAESMKRATQTIDIHHLSEGIYLLNVVVAGKCIYHSKVLIDRN